MMKLILPLFILLLSLENSEAQSVTVNKDSLISKSARLLWQELKLSKEQHAQLIVLEKYKWAQMDSIRKTSLPRESIFNETRFIEQKYFADVKKLLTPEQWYSFRVMEKAKHDAAINRLRSKGIPVQDISSPIPE